jgi:protein-S-isoprenylcysteine O-methyltransferase Ste14
MNLHTPQAIFLIGLVAYVAIRSVFQKRAAGATTTVTRSDQRDRFLVLLVVLGQIVLPLLYVFSPWLNFANYESRSFAPWLGAVTWLVGLWAFWRSHADLGTNWSVTLELRSTHQLVTQGVYRFVRHPMYAAFILFGVAQALLLPNWLAGPSALVAVALLCVIRIPNEEAMMCEFFGQEYRDYMKRTGGVIPSSLVAMRAVGVPGGDGGALIGRHLRHVRERHRLSHDHTLEDSRCADQDVAR